MTKIVPPSVNETAFNCPHCGAFTTQYWFNVHANRLGEEQRKPRIPDEEMKTRILEASDLEEKIKQNFLEYVEKMMSGLVFIEENKQGKYIYNDANNLFLSQCYNCRRVSVWVHDSLVFPPEKAGVQPNSDLPEDIIHDFEEARSILNQSPRGAAALLRLCIQKLCIFLGEEGKYLDTDIANLVSKGLNPLVQKSLDIVRVIGNEAVHPGVLDLKDDRDTALKLFELVNVIADQMITHPKNVEEMYKKIPPNKREAIDKRNERARKKE